jgi:hypothetical protein
MSIKGKRLARVESILAPRPPQIRAALAWQGVVRRVLVGVVAQDAPKGMTVADLLPGCVIFESNPQSEAALMFLGTDNKPHLQVVHDVCMDVIVGRASWEQFPMSEWWDIFKQQQGSDGVVGTDEQEPPGSSGASVEVRPAIR